jgi:hypothetical protein
MVGAQFTRRASDHQQICNQGCALGTVLQMSALFRSVAVVVLS